MKRIVLLGMVLCMVLGNVGCSNTKKGNENLNRIETEQGEDREEQNIEQETSQENKEITPMNASDLAVTDGENIVLLDLEYDDFNTTEEEIETDTSENHFVGEVYVGGYNYKTFFHQFKDFEIYTSNTEYPFKGEGINTYYITQISLLTDKYKTARGAYIGIDIKKVLELYGEGEIVSVSDYYDEKDCKGLSYRYDNYSLEFVYNDMGVVVHIDLYVLLREGDSIQEDNEKEQSEESETEEICRKIEFNQEIEIDLDNDGEADIVELKTKEEEGDCVTICICIDGDIMYGVTAEWYGDAYLIQNKNKKIGILFECWWSNDICKTYLCQIDGDKQVKQMEEITGSILLDTVTTSSFVMEDYRNIFGTWYGTCRYEITSDLRLKTVEDFQIRNDDENFITLKQDLIVDVRNDEIWCNIECKPDTKLYPIATDCEEYMYFKMDSGEILRIKFTMIDYQVYVDDVPVEELFDGIEIAG